MEVFAEFFEAIFEDSFTHVLHEFEVEVEVVHGHEAHAENFVVLKKVTNVSSCVAFSAFVLTVWVDRSKCFCMLRCFDLLLGRELCRLYRDELHELVVRSQTYPHRELRLRRAVVESLHP